jgi:DNA-binding NarL/FixJ family response regulator
MRVLIADDHELLRDTLGMFLGSEAIDTVLVGTLDDAVARCQSDGPFDLILLDFGMPGMNGLEGLDRARAANAGKPVALISGTAARGVADEALSRGAAGFLPKTLSAASLVNAVRFMASGERYAPVEFMTSHSHDSFNPLVKLLTPREMQVLGGLAKGKSNKEIARDLGVMEPTVKLHVKTLYRKIGAANRTQAAMIAKESGLY